MSKSPFVTLAMLALGGIFFALMAKSMGNSAGAEICLEFSTILLFFYATVRIIYDLLPARFVRECRRGRS